MSSASVWYICKTIIDDLQHTKKKIEKPSNQQITQPIYVPITLQQVHCDGPYTFEQADQLSSSTKPNMLIPTCKFMPEFLQLASAKMKFFSDMQKYKNLNIPPYY